MNEQKLQKSNLYIEEILFSVGSTLAGYLAASHMFSTVLAKLMAMGLTGATGLFVVRIRKKFWPNLVDWRWPIWVRVVELHRSRLLGKYFAEKYEKSSVQIMASALVGVLKEFAEDEPGKLCSALQNGIQVELCFLDPSCPIAADRARNESNIHFWDLMSRSMRYVQRIHNNLDRKKEVIVGSLIIAVTRQQIYNTIYRLIDKNGKEEIHWGPYSAHQPGLYLPFFRSSNPRVIAKIANEFAELDRDRIILLQVSQNEATLNTPACDAITAAIRSMNSQPSRNVESDGSASGAV